MTTIMNRLWDFKKSWFYKTRLERLQTDPSRNTGEQAMILNRLYEEMLESRPEPQKREAETLPETSPSSQSEPVKISQNPVSVMRLEPIPIN
jgi:hypothetical protein